MPFNPAIQELRAPGSPLGLYRRLMLVRMKSVSHQKKIARVPLAIFDPIWQQGFNVKPQSFKERPRIFMVSNHLGNNFS